MFIAQIKKIIKKGSVIGDNSNVNDDDNEKSKPVTIRKHGGFLCFGRTMMVSKKTEKAQTCNHLQAWWSPQQGPPPRSQSCRSRRLCGWPAIGD